VIPPRPSRLLTSLYSWFLQKRPMNLSEEGRKRLRRLICRARDNRSGSFPFLQPPSRSPIESFLSTLVITGTNATARSLAPGRPECLEYFRTPLTFKTVVPSRGATWSFFFCHTARLLLSGKNLGSGRNIIPMNVPRRWGVNGGFGKSCLFSPSRSATRNRRAWCECETVKGPPLTICGPRTSATRAGALMRR